MEFIECSRKEILSASQVSIGYKSHTRKQNLLASNLNLSIRQGDLIFFLGPNGVGKSTLIKTLAGIIPCISGSIELLGKDLSQWKLKELAKHRGLMLNEQLNPGFMSVFDVVAMGRYPYTNFNANLSVEDKIIISQSLAYVDLDHLKQSLFAELSDGQKQRALIARAIVQETSVLFLDEPTAFLDISHTIGVLQLLRKISLEKKLAIILSSHELALALSMAELLWLMDEDGLIHIGAPEDLVLSGLIEDVFAKDTKLSFNKDLGNFEAKVKKNMKVILRGNGVERYWTARALHRMGYEAMTGKDKISSKTPLIEIIQKGAKKSWIVCYEDNKKKMDSIYDMLKSLEQLISTSKVTDKIKLG